MLNFHWHMWQGVVTGFNLQVLHFILSGIFTKVHNCIMAIHHLLMKYLPFLFIRTSAASFCLILAWYCGRVWLVLILMVIHKLVYDLWWRLNCNLDDGNILLSEYLYYETLLSQSGLLVFFIYSFFFLASIDHHSISFLWMLTHLCDVLHILFAEWEWCRPF